MPIGEQGQPAVDGINIKSIPAVLVGIDVAVSAMKVAPGKEMKKNVGRMTGEGYGFSHYIDFINSFPSLTHHLYPIR
jgi:hypothetical protein